MMISSWNPIVLSLPFFLSKSLPPNFLPVFRYCALSSPSPSLQKRVTPKEQPEQTWTPSSKDGSQRSPPCGQVRRQYSAPLYCSTVICFMLHLLSLLLTFSFPGLPVSQAKPTPSKSKKSFSKASPTSKTSLFSRSKTNPTPPHPP